MNLPVLPPVAPMLARLARELPAGDHVYEPKWDGFRCVAFRDGDIVDLRSRNDRRFSRYFPELVEALRAVPERRFVADGEIAIMGRDGFGSLLGRLHPAASRVERLRRESPAAFVAFDLLAVGDEDLRAGPFRERRRALERLLDGTAGPLSVTPATDDVHTAREWLARYQGAGIDGVVAKQPDLPYQPGKRAMVKVKLERTADCVVAGFRWLVDAPLPSSLLLGLHDAGGELRHVGVAAAFSADARRRLLDRLAPLAISLEEHPWRDGFLVGPNPAGRLKGSADRWTPDMEMDWVPLRPALVCEVAYDQVDADRFRHPARFRRWRPDRDAASCRLDQLAVATPDLEGVPATG